MPPAIAAVMPITVLSRFASATSASAKTCVYCGGAAGGFGSGGDVVGRLARRLRVLVLGAG